MPADLLAHGAVTRFGQPTAHRLNAHFYLQVIGERASLEWFRDDEKSACADIRVRPHRYHRMPRRLINRRGILWYLCGRTLMSAQALFSSSRNHSREARSPMTCR